jgi:hypothetical protein
MFESIKKISNYVYAGEILELDVEDLIKNENNYFKKKFLILKIFFIRIFRDLYRTYQRKAIKPSLRKKLITLETSILNFFEKNENASEKEEDMSLLMKEKSAYLKSSSYVIIDNIFNNEEIKAIKSYLNSIQEFLELSEGSTGEKMSMRYYKTKDLIKNDLIMKGANNPKLLNILDNYFNGTYKLDWIWSWWSFADLKNSVGPQLFHRDYETMNFVKVFVYLTDVENNDGSHQIVSGSHNVDKLYEIERFSDKSVISNFGSQKIININGKEGTSFIANTFAIHKGFKPKINDRLVLVYLYSTVPSRRSPKLPPIKFDNIKNYQSLFKKNKKINNLFIDFK